MFNSSVFGVLGAVFVASGVCSAQPEVHHLMQIEQVVGGIGGDVTKQAIQLRMRAGNQQFITGTRLVAYNAAGTNAVTLISFVSNASVGGLGARVLVVSPSLAPSVAGDFVMNSTIPPSYLLAGRLTFEDSAGQILWSLAWGGANYTGSNLGLITNDPDGNFGPPYPGPLPLTENRALQFQGPASAMSTTNLADYALTPGAATLTNNAGVASVLGAACYANCNGDTNATGGPLLNLADFGCFQTRFATGHPAADCNGDGLLNLADFGCFQTKFAVGCS